MELKRWIVIGAVGITVGGGLMLRGVGQTAAPAVQPPAVASPTAKPAAIAPPVADRNDNGNGNNNSRRGNSNGRGNRRNRGENSSSGSGYSGTDPFGVLQERSIFVKGNQNVASDSRTAPVYQPTGPLGGKPESSLVFNGVIVVNSEANALVEDLTTHDVVNVHAGDAIAGGRVSGISFDDLAYSANGRTLHVAIGQNLEGVTASVAAPPPAPSTPVTPAVAPADNSAAPSPSVAVPAPGDPGAAAPATPGKWDFTKPMPTNLSPADKEAWMKARHAAGM
jgi:hypothetical protein